MSNSNNLYRHKVSGEIHTWEEWEKIYEIMAKEMNDSNDPDDKIPDITGPELMAQCEDDLEYGMVKDGKWISGE